MIRLIFFIPLFTLCVHLCGQSGTLSGNILDAAGSPLAGAVVVVDDKYGTVADFRGKYKLRLPAGTVDVRVSFVGFEPTSNRIEVEAGEETSLDVTLMPSILQLKDVLITTLHEDVLQHVSAYDIRVRPVNTSQDLLRYVPGLFIAQHAGGGKAEQIFLRGFDLDHGTDFEITVDGMPVNMVSHAHGQGYSDLHFLIPETVAGIEFNKGPYYADKGNFNTSGYAAFQTFDRLRENSIKVEGGQFNTFRTVAMINILPEKLENSGLYMATEIFLTDGYFDSDQDFRRYNFFSKYSTRFKNGDHLAITGSTFYSRWNASGQIPERAVKSGEIGWFGAIDDTEGGETDRTNFQAVLTNELGDEISLTQQIYYTNYNFRLFSNFTFFLEDPVNGDQIRQEEHRNLYGYKGNFMKSFYTEAAKYTTHAIAEVRIDDINDISLAHTLNRQQVLEWRALGDINEANLSAALGQTIEFNRFSIYGGVRFDHFIQQYDNQLEPASRTSKVSRSIVSPKLRLNFKPTQNLNLFLKAGTGFHSNDTRTVTGQETGEILPRAYGLDMGMTIKPAPNLLINTTFWILDIEQEYVYVGDAAIVELSGPTRRYGMDISLRYQVLAWLYLDSDLDLTHPRFKDVPDGENYVPLAPTITSTGGLHFASESGLNASVRYRYLGKRPADESYQLTADGYFLLDAVCSYIIDSFEFGVSIENILNSKWKEAQFETESRLMDEPAPVSEIHFTPGTPFALRAGVTWRF